MKKLEWSCWSSQRASSHAFLDRRHTLTQTESSRKELEAGSDLHQTFNLQVSHFADPDQLGTAHSFPPTGAHASSRKSWVLPIQLIVDDEYVESQVVE